MRWAIDFDGTIADTNRAKSAWILANLGREIPPWQCDRTSCVPLIGREAYEQLSAVIYEREASLSYAEVPGASVALRQLANRGSLFVITARPPDKLAFAVQWCERAGLRPLIQEFYSSSASSKQEICQMLSAQALVDDDLRHLVDVRQPGLRRLWMQDGRPDPIEEHEGVISCRSWAEVLDRIDG